MQAMLAECHSASISPSSMILGHQGVVSIMSTDGVKYTLSFCFLIGAADHNQADSDACSSCRLNLPQPCLSRWRRHQDTTLQNMLCYSSGSFLLWFPCTPKSARWRSHQRPAFSSASLDVSNDKHPLANAIKPLVPTEAHLFSSASSKL